MTYRTQGAFPPTNSVHSSFGDPTIRITTGANTLTLQNLACHSRFRRESDAVYRAAV